MSQNIGEAQWKSIAKKLKLELADKGLLKALAALDRTDVAKPVPRVEALDDVLDEARKLASDLLKRKKELEDKVFGEVKGELQDLIDNAEKLLKQAREAALGEDEEAESPVLLTSKMVPLIKELRKGEVSMHALIGTTGRETAVLIRRRPISASMRKLVGEAIGAKGGAKYIPAECVFEEQALTFIVQTQAAGLAKKLKAALLDQTSLRLKVRVRGEEPNDLDEDGEAAETEGEEAGRVVDAADLSSTPAAEKAPAPTERPAFTEMMQRLTPRLVAALRGPHPELAKLKALSSFVNDKARAGDHAAAMKALALLDGLLSAETAASATAPETPDAGATFKARLTALLPKLRQSRAEGHPAAQEANLKASEAGALALKSDFATASRMLDEIESLLRQDPVQASLARQWLQRLANVSARYEDVLQTQPANASALRAILGYAQGAAERLDYAVALKTLVRLEKEMDAAPQLGKETDVIPDGLVKKTVERLEVASGRWREVRFQSIEGLEALMRTLRAHEDTDLHKIADRVDVLTRAIPSEIESSLKKLTASMRSKDEGAILVARRQVQADLDKCESYLKDNLNYIEMCEENPFDGVPVTIQKPLQETLRSIRSSLAEV